MSTRPEQVAPEGPSLEVEARDPRVRRFATRTTMGVIVLCNAVFLAGLWASGLDLNQLIRTPDIYNPKQDVCVRFGWHKVSGVEKPVRLCAEWINLSDPSGRTHQFHRGTAVLQGADGKLYFDHAPWVDYRLFLFALYFTAVIVLGVVLNRFLINRYRARLSNMGREGAP